MTLAPKRRKPVQRERAFQMAVARFLALALPDHALAFAIPGGDRHQTRTPGYVPGTPDLMIVYRGNAFFIELKAGKAGRVSLAQGSCHQALVECGAKVAICRSLDDIADACMAWSIPLRARIAPGGVVVKEAA